MLEQVQSLYCVQSISRRVTVGSKSIYFSPFKIFKYIEKYLNTLIKYTQIHLIIGFKYIRIKVFINTLIIKQIFEVRIQLRI